MDELENFFSTDNEIVEKLKSYASRPDYNTLFFENLGVELKKFFISKKDKVLYKNFYEASSYEYGFFDMKIDLQKAFSLYKKYADANDYLCMYKMHIIYLCEYEKFNVPLSRILEKIYLFKCLAYAPNYFYDWRLKIFEKIDVIFEIAQILDLEDGNLEKHKHFFDLLKNQREKYNLSENDIDLMKGTLCCYFNIEGEDDPNKNILAFSILYSITPKIESDYTYFLAKNKCVYFRNHLKLEKNIFSDSEIEAFYKEVENKKLYEFYTDYGNYLLDKTDKSNQKIIEILTASADNGDLFAGFRCYQSLIDFYDFDEVIKDYDKASKILDHLTNEILFDKTLYGQFYLLIGYLIKYSKYPEKIISKYLVYIKELNDFITLKTKQKETDNVILTGEDDYLFSLKGYTFFFGFNDIEERNIQKANEYFDKAANISEKVYNQKRYRLFKYRTKEVMNGLKLISKEELLKEKKDLIEYFLKNPALKYQLTDCFLIGQNYFEGITFKKDEYIAKLLFEEAVNKRFCKTILDWKIRSEIIKFLKDNENKFENKIIDEICCICYEKKVNKIFIPCKHNFCSFCSDMLEKDKKCPVCRSEILCIL